MTYDDMIAAIQAAKEGKKLQCRQVERELESDWFDIECDPVWNFANYEYRPRPELKPDVVQDYVALMCNTHVYLVSAYNKVRPANLRLTYSGKDDTLIAAEVLK